MNGSSIVLDTNIILYLLRGNIQIASMLDEMIFFVSILTEIELLGYTDITIEDKNQIREFLSECTIVSLDDHIKDLCINIKQSIKIKTPDAIVAATALSLQIPLITADKGFEKIQDLDLFLYKL